MQINFSTASRIAYLILLGVFLRALVAITYGWSFGATERFSVLVTGADYAFWFSVAVQFGQQPVLILRELIKDPRIRRILTVAFFLMAGIDFITNFGDFTQWFAVADKSAFTPLVVQIAYLVGIIACAVVVVLDEFGIWLIGAMFYILGLILADLGVRTPKWFNIKGAQKAAQMASGASAANFPSPEEIMGPVAGRPDRGDGGYGGRQRATS